MFLPAACVSVGMKGQELTDMDALKAAGAVDSQTMESR